MVEKYYIIKYITQFSKLFDETLKTEKFFKFDYMTENYYTIKNITQLSKLFDEPLKTKKFFKFDYMIENYRNVENTTRLLRFFDKPLKYYLKHSKSELPTLNNNARPNHKMNYFIEIVTSILNEFKELSDHDKKSSKSNVRWMRPEIIIPVIMGFLAIYTTCTTSNKSTEDLLHPINSIEKNLEKMNKLSGENNGKIYDLMRENQKTNLLILKELKSLNSKLDNKQNKK